MKWNIAIKIINENQGVVAVVLFILAMLGSFIGYVLKRERKATSHIKSGGASVNIIGSHNYVEWTNINQQWGIEQNKPSIILKDKRKFECTLAKAQIPNMEGLYYKFDFNNKSFVINVRNLDGLVEQKDIDRSQIKIANKELIKVLKQFMLFDEESSAISSSDNLFLHISKELSKTDIFLQVNVSISDLLSIPFQNLSSTDFGVTAHTFKIVLEQ